MSNKGGWPFPDRPGVPLNPERDGWHWLGSDPKRIPDFPSAMNWDASRKAWRVGNGVVPAAIIAGNGWHYHEPVLTPAEVAAHAAAAAEAMREACAIEAGTTDCPRCYTPGDIETRIRDLPLPAPDAYARALAAAKREGMDEAAGIAKAAAEDAVRRLASSQPEHLRDKWRAVFDTANNLAAAIRARIEMNGSEGGQR